MSDAPGSALDDYFVSVPPPRLQGPTENPRLPGAARPQPRTNRRWILGLPLIALLAVGGYVVATREAPPDRRPVVLPETLDGLSLASDTNSREYREQMERQSQEWWPDRAAAFALYASDSARSASFRDLAGPHVMVVRGRFGDRGDARLGERYREQTNSTIATPQQTIGANTCEKFSEALTVCWRETDRLSVSVLTLDRSDPTRVSGQVDQIWAAVR